MSLTLVFFYIIIGLCFLLFINYKFLKLFITPNRKFAIRDANSNTTSMSNKNHNSTENDVWSIPGPVSIPFIGTKWIYFWKYKLSKIHEVYRGERTDGQKSCFNI